eukprot:TRINITY_DN2694_c0_g1_i5.p1 TRINITY_DN2694_c0_g1~~TRINITY_DN2694_c0_g1_i5.p1  ORF type:complete len:787 (+),score=236.60 TRINITY_DN2694_c0_g1_i5:29-2389(+)
MKSEDYKEAIGYYNRAIELDASNSIFYCNRALAHLKLKSSKECIADCNKALELQPGYAKALHRRGKAYMNLSQYEMAVKDFQEILKSEPQNAEVNNDLRDARQHLTEEQRKKIDSVGKPAEVSQEKKEEAPKGGEFKRIMIEEESDDEEEGQTVEEPVKKEEAVPAEKEDEVKDKHEGMTSFEKIIDQIITDGQKSDKFEEELERVCKLLEEANAATTDTKYDEAIPLYENCLNSLNNLRLEAPPQTVKDIDELKMAALIGITNSHQELQDTKKVIDYASLILAQEQATTENKIAAFFLRGWAFTATFDYELARKDYEALRKLDPSNLKASELLTNINSELFRLKNKDHQNVSESPRNKEEEEKATLENRRESCEKLKETGNKLFKTQNYEEAIQNFSIAIREIESHYGNSLTDPRLEAIKKLYLSHLLNRGLCHSKIKNYHGSIEDSTKVLQYDPKNIKALFRRGTGHLYVGKNLQKDPNQDQLAYLKAQAKIYREAFKDLDAVVKMDPNDADARARFDELKNEEIYLNLTIKKLEESGLHAPKTDEQPGKKETAASEREKPVKKEPEAPAPKQVEKPKQEEPRQEQPKPEQPKAVQPKQEQPRQEQPKANVAPVSAPNVQEETKGESPTVQRDRPARGVPAKELTKSIEVRVIDDILTSKSIPETQTQFENDSNALKRQLDKFYLYLKKIPREHFLKLYNKRELSAEMCMLIVRALNTHGISDDIPFTSELLTVLTQTNRFSLNICFLSKAEKKEVEELFNTLIDKTDEKERVTKLKAAYLPKM